MNALPRITGHAWMMTQEYLVSDAGGLPIRFPALAIAPSTPDHFSDFVSGAEIPSLPLYVGFLLAWNARFAEERTSIALQ
jgi:hypothetical protein